MKKIPYFVIGCVFSLALVVGFLELNAESVGTESTLKANYAPGDFLTGQEFTRLVTILKGIGFYPDAGGPRYVFGRDQFDADDVKGVDGNLDFDFEGNLGATKYCDGTGQNCKAFAELGAGGGRGHYVGSLPSMDGDDAPLGYADVDAKCDELFNADTSAASVNDDARLCTAFDIMYSLGLAAGAGVVAVPGVADGAQYWVAAGPPGYFAGVNDCGAFKYNVASDGSDYYGAVYNTTLGQFSIRPCGAAAKAFCCSK